MTFEELSPVSKSTMCRLFLFGPLHDARAAKFEAGLADLVAAGWAARAEPWSYLTRAGTMIAGAAKVTDKSWQYKQAGA